jgi:hypothetical protein
MFDGVSSKIPFSIIYQEIRRFPLLTYQSHPNTSYSPTSQKPLPAPGPRANLQASSSAFFAISLTLPIQPFTLPRTPSSCLAFISASANLARSLAVPSAAYGFCTYPGGCCSEPLCSLDPRSIGENCAPCCGKWCDGMFGTVERLEA